jgi:hypothetical protein
LGRQCKRQNHVKTLEKASFIHERNVIGVKSLLDLAYIAEKALVPIVLLDSWISFPFG